MTHNTPSHPSSASPPLRMLFWESTAACNLACVHCRRLDIEACRDELTTDEAKAVFTSAAELGKPIVVFSGGEPLMRDDWETLAGHCESLGLPTALATNGTLVDAPLAERIANAGFRRVSISLDGADAATHDTFRGLSGAFHDAIAGLQALQAAGVPTQLNVTITRHNVEQIDELYALALELNVVAMHLFLLVPVGCGEQIGESQQLPPETYETVLHWICDRQAEEKIELRATCAPHYYRVAAQRGINIGHSRGCLCGISVAFVSHRGEVFPCGYLPVECGQVRETPFADIWRDSEVFANLRDYDKLTGKCGPCNFKAICGGCRARAHAEYDDYLAQEPTCNFQPDLPE